MGYSRFSNSLRFARPSSLRGAVFCMPCPCGVIKLPPLRSPLFDKEGQLFCMPCPCGVIELPPLRSSLFDKEGQLFCAWVLVGHPVLLLVMLSEVETSLFLYAVRTRHAVSLRCHIKRMGESLYSFIAIIILPLVKREYPQGVGDGLFAVFELPPLRSSLFRKRDSFLCPYVGVSLALPCCPFAPLPPNMFITKKRVATFRSPLTLLEYFVNYLTSTFWVLITPLL